MIKRDRREENRRYYQNHKTEFSKYYQNHKKKMLKEMKNIQVLLKQEVLTHYGNGKCACIKCGFENINALSIDHIDGTGAEHRREIRKSGTGFYCWLRDNGFPEGYQTLCMNCQFIKRFEEREDYASQKLKRNWALLTGETIKDA